MHTGCHSGFLPCDRDIIIYLPPGYDENPEARYPLFYLHDGQNLFDEETAFGWQEWVYAAMIVNELKPFIDAEDRTLKDPADTAMGGSSPGGLVTRYIGPGHPEIFGKLAVLSPSVWWNRA
jgi:enterochelin esterase-like enzyme